MKVFTLLIFIFVFAFVAMPEARAQYGVDASGRPLNDKDEMPKGIKEAIEKSRIEQSKKDYAEMIERGEEAVQISSELEKSFELTNNLSASDQNKLQKLEKLIKKIRDELGGDDDDIEVAENEPLSSKSAIERLKDTSVNLLDELNKMTRYSISAAAIQSSNVLIKIARFLRSGKK